MLLVTERGLVDVGRGAGIGHVASAAIIDRSDLFRSSEIAADIILTRLVRVSEIHQLLSELSKLPHHDQHRQMGNEVSQSLDSILQLRLSNRHIPQLLEWLRTQGDDFQLVVALPA